jgi:hypothetical protein
MEVLLVVMQEQQQPERRTLATPALRKRLILLHKSGS